MKFRPWPVEATKMAVHEKRSKPLTQTLEPRSAYVIAGAARTRRQHHIPPTEAFRYSITFRTLPAG
jgi:alkylated DNA repair dioxygenase AlkB